MDVPLPDDDDEDEKFKSSTAGHSENKKEQ
jgi:hypothetical protein